MNMMDLFNYSCFSNMETIIIIRHGEKPQSGLGQLNCKGLNRSLLLPKYFSENYPTANYIFAPNPGQKHLEHHGDGNSYNYIRPLATIEPTAISLGLPVNTSFGSKDIVSLVSELLNNKYHSSVIYMAWEHSDIVKIASLLYHHFNLDSSTIPDWHKDDYDTVFEFKIDWTTKTLKLQIKKQPFINISSRCLF